MATEDEISGRTNPPGNDQVSDEEEFNFSTAAPGDFRAKVTPYNTPAQYPIAPLYNVGEEAYLQVQGQTQPAGPYEVVEVLTGYKYRIKMKATGQEHHELVSENKLLVRA